MNIIDSFHVLDRHAFRDEAKQSIFNLTKIYQQIDFNEELNNTAHGYHR